MILNFPLPVLAAEIRPDLRGAELLQMVKKDYAPDKTLGYRKGRDILYTKIDNQNGVVTGIYSDYSIKVNPNSDSPRKDAFQQDINAEHIYPQSKGAKGSAKSDLHSLFAAQVDVNRERGNSPFAEIDDSLTKKWLRKEQELRTIPTESIDEFSESLTNKAFEPRESKKGDVARAMFYFYTIYRFRADAEDPNFFPKQQTTLCRWNAADSVDSAEITRSHQVAQYQGNENPFVIDPTLAQRTYCQ
ncbi:MAG: hypothetical protein F6K47_07960 [Symploca sp. SIO2E6]|nr:hypothetical protein [Symploca sp. SIO2E6]